MIRSVFPLTLALVVGTGASLLAQQPAPIRRPAEPRPEIREAGPDQPAIHLPTVLYTTALRGSRHTCTAVNVSGAPVEITIELFRPGTGKVETVEPCQRRMVEPGRTCFIVAGTLYTVWQDDKVATSTAYCRISSPADRSAFRGALVSDEVEWGITNPYSQPPVAMWIPIVMRAVATAE